MHSQTELSSTSSGTVPENRRRFPPASVAVTGVILALAYSVIVAVAIRTHEPWADEAQSWLIARDANLLEIWTKLVRLEGSPGLWHSLLHVLISLGRSLLRSELRFWIPGTLGCTGHFLLFALSARRSHPAAVYILSVLPVRSGGTELFFSAGTALLSGSSLPGETNRLVTGPADSARAGQRASVPSVRCVRVRHRVSETQDWPGVQCGRA